MPYDLVVAATVTAHLLVLVYLAVGGFLAWRLPRTLLLHVGVVLWGIGSIVVRYPCPLTAVEQWARERAGREPLPPGGFIKHYLTGTLYPERYVVAVQVLVGLLVVVSWVGLARNRKRPQPPVAGVAPHGQAHLGGTDLALRSPWG